jgi:hypothetical protein
MARPRVLAAAGAGAAAVVAAGALVVSMVLAPAPMGVTATCDTPPRFPQNPIWCFPAGTPAPVSRLIDSRGGWLDTFDTGVSLGRFITGDGDYQIFNAGSAGDDTAIRSQSFVHANHWMVDLKDNSQFNLSGGVLVSPNRLFQFENGKLTIESDLAPGDQLMTGGANVFYEIDISPARPTGIEVDSLYGYGQMGGAGGLGCRFEFATEYGGIHQVCAMYDDSTRTAGGLDQTCPVHPCATDGRSGRVWETQGVGTDRTSPSVIGGYGGYHIPGTTLTGSDVARVCDPVTNPAAAMPDQFCRDRYRMEITKDSIRVFINGFDWFDITGLFARNPETGADNRIPDSWIANGVYVYFTSWINSGQHQVSRWHWDRAMVNAHDAGGAILPLSKAPSYCFGSPFNTCPQPTPKPSVSASATASPTSTVIIRTPSPTPRTPSPTATRTPSPTPTATAPTIGTCKAVWNGIEIESKLTTQANCGLR